jgi:hypothetical protein
MPAIRARRALVVALSASILASLSVVGFASSASASTVPVAPGDDISAAIASASAGDIIQLGVGTYTENVDVSQAVTLEGAGSGSTTIVGTLTLNAVATVTGLTLEGQTTTPSSTVSPWAPTTLWINPAGAGSTITGNVLKNGYQDVYAQGVVATAADPTVVSNNTIQDFHADQGTGVWIAQSNYFTVSHNTITDGTPIDDNATGVNLVCGSSHVTIDSNTISDVGNATVDIANGSCGTSTDIAITNNSVGPTSGSALYFGGNNETDVTIGGNSFHSVGGSSGAVVLSGSSNWIASPGSNISGFVVESNSISGAPNGLYLGNGVLLDGNSSVLSENNTWCSSGSAIANLTTGGFTVESLNDNDCGSAVSPGVVVPQGPSAGGGTTRTASKALAAVVTPTPVPTAESLAITGDGASHTKAVGEPALPKKTVATRTSGASPLPWILLVLGALVLVAVVVFVVRRARQI